jgi:transcriptional regulator with XRE-family HTH domain
MTKNVNTPLDTLIKIIKNGGMKLADYLRARNISQRAFAAETAIAAETVSRLVNGRLRPGRKMMERIASATGNAVRPNDWFDIAEHHEPPTTEAA